MGYSRDYAFYPPEVAEAVERAFEGKGEIIFTAPTDARARSIRGQFYAYFRALRRAAHDSGLPANERGIVQVLSSKADQLTVYAEGTSVILTLKGATPEMNEFRRTLANGLGHGINACSLNDKGKQ